MAAPTKDRFSELYRLHGPAIYSRCRRILRDPLAAEDAAQETFLRVYRHLDFAPPSEQVLRWIYRIATNYCLNEIRNKKNRPTAIDPFAIALADKGGEDRLSDRDLVKKLMKAPDRMRIIAWLHHVEGFEQEEVAGIMGVSRRTVAYDLVKFSKRANHFLNREAV